MPILGKTLMNIGSQLPDIYRTNRRLGEERLDRQRRTEREDKTWEQQQEEYARKKALEREAQSSIEGYESGVRAQTPLPEGQEGPVAPQRSRYELGMESGLPRYQKVSPEVEGLWGAVEEEEKGRRTSEALGTKLGQQQSQFDQRLQQQQKQFEDRLSQQKLLSEQRKDNKTSADFKDTTTLRKEYNAISKTFNEVRDAYNRVQASSDDPSAAGDLALIFNYMKILDPGSVVRESEFAQAASTGSYGEKLKAAGAKLVKGERLSFEMRKDFLDRAQKLYDKQANTQRRNINRYTELANKRGIDPADVVGSSPIQEQETDTGWNDEKESRYQELLRKKQSGTIGK